MTTAKITRKQLLSSIAQARREWAKFKRRYPEGAKVATLRFPSLPRTKDRP